MKLNRSGSTSVVAVEKIRGCYRELQTIGVASDDIEITNQSIKAKRGSLRSRQNVTPTSTSLAKSTPYLIW